MSIIFIRVEKVQKVCFYANFHEHKKEQTGVTRIYFS